MPHSKSAACSTSQCAAFARTSTRWRRIRSSSDFYGTNRQPGASFLLGNADGSLWTDLAGEVPAPPHAPRLDSPTEYRRAGALQISATDAVVPTPWLVTIEIPRRIAMAPAREFLYGAVIIALLMMALGVIAAWGVSRSITRPMDDISRAAEGIAEGDYAVRARVSSDNELGRLAAS